MCMDGAYHRAAIGSSRAARMYASFCCTCTVWSFRSRSNSCAGRASHERVRARGGGGGAGGAAAARLEILLQPCHVHLERGVVDAWLLRRRLLAGVLLGGGGGRRLDVGLGLLLLLALVAALDEMASLPSVKAKPVAMPIFSADQE